MHFQPTATEQTALPQMADRERILYFLTRTIECEEIWAHADSDGWVLHEKEDKIILPVWPYQGLANDCIADADLWAESTSLERFIEVLERVDEDIHLEILPLPDRRGALIAATEVLTMFEGLIDSGTYFLEG